MRPNLNNDKIKVGWEAIPPVPYIVLPMLSLCRYFNRDGVSPDSQGL